MCLRQHWEKYKTSPAYHTAKKISLELEEFARKSGHNKHNIRVRNKGYIIKEGFSKADAQVVWEDGPDGWANSFYITQNELGVDCIAENSYTLSFYDK